MTHRIWTEQDKRDYKAVALNPKRGKDKTTGTSKRRLKDEVQRLTTYNTLVLGALRELLQYHDNPPTDRYAPELEDCIRRCRKVAA